MIYMYYSGFIAVNHALPSWKLARTDMHMQCMDTCISRNIYTCACTLHVYTASSMHGFHHIHVHVHAHVYTHGLQQS